MNRFSLPILAGIVAVSACDCDDAIRRHLSDDSEARKMKPTTTGPSGPAETEPNDEELNASRIEIGRELRPVSGRIDSAGDVDWFALTTKSGEREKFEVTVEPTAELDVSLSVGSASYDAAQVGGAESIPALSVGREPTAFAIRRSGGAAGDYTIRLKRRLEGEGLETEPNDDLASAGTFPLPGAVQGYYGRKGDRDVFKLVGPSNTPMVFEFAPVRGVRQLARLYADPALRVPVASVSVAPEAAGRLPNVALSPDRPVFLVMEAMGDVDPQAIYRVDARPHPPFDGTLETEPNDTVPMEVSLPAEPLRIGGYLHAADDRDQFRVFRPEVAADPVSEGDETLPEVLRPFADKKTATVPLSARLTWTDEQSNLGLRWVLDSEPVAEFRQSSEEREVVGCGLTLGGEEILEVRAERLGKLGEPGKPDYVLELADAAAGTTWEAEPNDDRRRADVLVGTRRGALASVEDVDVWAFAVEAPEGTQSVQIDAEARETDLVMRVLDEDGGLIANVDNGTLGLRERFRLDLPGGLYFVELRWKSGSVCQPYELKVSR